MSIFLSLQEDDLNNFDEEYIVFAPKLCYNNVEQIKK